MWRKQTAQGVLWINDSRIHENMKVAGDDSAVKLACCKLFVDSKSGRCNFWDFLLCDDRRSRWWASRDGPQHDRSRSDTVMISMHFNSYASLAIFFISFLFFSAFFFWTWTYICYTSVNWVWFLLPYVSLQSIWAWKPSIFGPSISFCLWIFVSAHAIVT